MKPFKDNHRFTGYILVTLFLGIFIGAAGAFYAVPRLPNNTLRKLIWTPVPYQQYAPIKRSLKRTFKAFKYRAAYSDLSAEEFKEKAYENTTPYVKKNFDLVDFHPYYNDDNKIVYGRLRFKSKVPDINLPGNDKGKPIKKFIDAIPVHMNDGTVGIVAVPDSKGYLLHEIYNRPALLSYPSKPVLVVEGEASADAAKDLFTDFAVISLPLGLTPSNCFESFAILEGRDIVIWPDTDSFGGYFANHVATLIEKATGTPVATVDVPGDFPARWDLANPPPEGYSVDDLKAMAEKALSTVRDRHKNRLKKPTKIIADTNMKKKKLKSSMPQPN